MAAHKRRPPVVLPEMVQAGIKTFQSAISSGQNETDICILVYVAMLHARLDARRGIPRERVATALRDNSRTIVQIAADLGISYSIARAVADEFGIRRYRGGDRRSPEARARYRHA